MFPKLTRLPRCEHRPEPHLVLISARKSENISHSFQIEETLFSIAFISLLSSHGMDIHFNFQNT